VGAQFVREFDERDPQIKIVGEQYTGNTCQQLITRAAAALRPHIAVGVPPRHAPDLGVPAILAPVEGYVKTSRSVRQTDVWPRCTKT
jgi:hypothetical protein